MNQESGEEQRPIPQTFCGALQKEANCKCLVLSVLIYGCLAAVTWCRCANVTKVVIDFLKYPITRTKHVSPCDDGYVYIPVAFMGMLYLVYLVECYHSPIRIDLLHARSQDSILTKLSQLKMAQATIWWKAISYHYVRRKRQITRYRNGDNYTTTQVYYERVNTHAATSFYFYGYCGVKDISKDLILDPKLPITKISLTKGFAFSNMRSATEFEEARSRFFAEQEHRDDYMEMREGLDLGYNFNPTSLVAVLGKPWFTNAYVYWSLSALLLSWPLRIIIECNTQYTDYQITKLFGINYDAPTANGQPIHASSSQLSAPGSYMLVPSYSEALLMEPAPVPARSVVSEEPDMEMVPSYSEALLYERAYDLQGEVTVEQCPDVGNPSSNCECPCHSVEGSEIPEAGSSSGIENQIPEDPGILNIVENPEALRTNDDRLSAMEIPEDLSIRNSDSCDGNTSEFDIRTCSNCNEFDSNGIESTAKIFSENRLIGGGSGRSSMEVLNQSGHTINVEKRFMQRENSEPNLRTNSELFSANILFARTNGQSLENILEHDETDLDFANNHSHGIQSRNSSRAEALILEDDSYDSCSSPIEHIPIKHNANVSRGAIPKKLETPIQERPKKIPNSRTYFCIKSILKQHRRRYTLVTPEELQNLVTTDQNSDHVIPGSSTNRTCNPHCCGAHWERIDVNSNTVENSSIQRGQIFQGSLDSLNSSGRQGDFTMQKRDSSRTLIFASPIQEICPSDPFGGRTLVPSENPPNYEEALDLPVLSRLKRSFTERETRNTTNNVRKHHRTFSIEPEYLFTGNRTDERRCQGDNIPYDVVIPVQNSRIIMPSQYRRAISEDGGTTRDISAGPGISAGTSGSYCQESQVDSTGRFFRLTRSLTERNSSRSRNNNNNNNNNNGERNFRRSLTDRIEFSRNSISSNRKVTNINMETSL